MKSQVGVSAAVSPITRSVINRILEKPEFHTHQKRLIDKRKTLGEGRKVNLVHEADKLTWTQLLELFSFDWYHLLLTLPWRYIALLVGVIQALHILVFGILYLIISDPNSEHCNLNSNEEELPFQATFGFSLITMATVGYGTLDDTPAFFNNCSSFPIIVFFQVITFITLDGLLINLFYQRMGRSDPRANRVIFSKKASIKFINGKFHLLFQIYDLERKTPLLSSHVRCYVVRQSAEDNEQVEIMNMRLSYTDDDFGSYIFLGLPAIIGHEIDNFSPLFPLELTHRLIDTRRDYFAHDAKNNVMYPGIALRKCDSLSSSLRATCPSCGKTFISTQALLNHVRYNQMMDRKFDKTTKIPTLFKPSSIQANVDKYEMKKRLATFRGRNRKKDANHLELSESMLISEFEIYEGTPTKETEHEFVISKESFQSKLEHHFENTNLEIIVLVEAIEPGASGSFQAKSSYKISDIEFDSEPKKCVFSRRGRACVDLDAFNEVEPVI